MSARKVIVHYHIFKNAGTSVDHMLRESLGDRWVAWDGTTPGSRISPSELELFIGQHPEAIAFSSHQIVPPLPGGNLNVFPIVFVRHPLDRAYSAYLFEWAKQKGLASPTGSFEQFVTEKFHLKRKSAIEDFQAFHLANRGYHNRTPSGSLDDEEILRNAKEFLLSLPFFGIVERYDDSLQLMRARYQEHFPQLSFRSMRRNALQDVGLSLFEKVKRIKASVSADCLAQLTLRNQLDLRLYEFAEALFLRNLREPGRDPART